MGLLSFFRKDRQESSARDSDFYSRADEEQPGRTRRKSKRDEPVDPVLPEKKRARRRLVGAVALVLAAVIGLPMILDSEPKPLSDDVAIQIPSKDTPAPATKAESKPVATASTPSSNETPQSSLSAGEEVVEQTLVRAAEKSVEPPKQLAKPVVPEPTPAPPVTTITPPTPAKPAAVAKVEPAPAKQQPPSIDKHDTSAEAARARAILEGRAADKPAAKPVASANAGSTGKVSLQVAALTSQDKVNELQKKLQAAGLKSYTQKVSTAAGDRIRVRVGPFASEAEAEKAKAKLAGIGLSGTVTH
ncbi:SPOR domain-containing protein [uncultured Oxalicibacterium sp.]|uniref:SPOR domain-containing protein n=1 Tax=uncultured Oxalicibacterium sp. TaxID=1168540 RepID=UPI0025D88E9C|nr:SPOR domain-containing protein [uncultured Oxalicibacterium sp.]